MPLSQQLAHIFRKAPSFSLQDAYNALPNELHHSIRARIYEGIKKNEFVRLSRGVFSIVYKNNDGSESTCLLIQGDGRDLSFLEGNSIDCIITDHPYLISRQLKGGNRDFASYDLFQYNQKNLDEKFRVLKPGHFLVEFLPEESAENFEYVTKVKQMALQAGFEYYSKVPWIKDGFVANTGRKSKNSEDVVFFTKGKARAMRPDVKKDKANPGKRHFMSGAAGMLPAQFVFAPPSKNNRLHQAEKPVSLLQAVLNFVTYQNERVLDQFAGSGSLGEACALSKRDSILIEKDPSFVKIIRDRLELCPVPPFA